MPVKRTPLSAPRPGAAKKSPTTSSSASRLSKPKTTTSRSSPAKAKTKTSTTRSSPSTRTSVTKPKAKTTTTRSTRSPISRAGVKPKPVAKSSTLKAKKAAEAKRKQEAEEAEEAEREYQAQLAANRAQNKLINDRLKAEREEEERKKKAAADREAGFLTPDAKGVRHCPIDFMPKAIEAVRKDGKTPLIIDPSKRVDVYYTYTAVVISCKGIFINNRIHGQPLEDVLDQARRKVSRPDPTRSR